jgi:DNA-binding SARP family transcriptional activator/ABC-type transport system substrate-binding protein/streptogramin lyase
MDVRILGSLEVRSSGTVADLGHAKQRTVLGVLVLHRNEVVSTERLIDELWGVQPPPTATKLIQHYVSHLRRQLKGVGIDGVVRTQAPGYVVHLDEESLDAARFEQLLAGARALRDQQETQRAADAYREGLALWRGKALADLSFESFARNEVERLNEARLDALTERIDCDLALGRHAELIGELEGLVATHPLREGLREKLMLALYRSGRQSEALAVYQDTRRALRDELGLEPSPSLRQLQQEILRQDESLAALEPAASHAEASTAVEPEPRGRSLMTRAVLVGIAASLLVLGLAAFAATRGRSSGIPVRPNSVAVIDPKSDKVVADIPVGVGPTSIAGGHGSVWVGNLDDKSVSRIDPRSMQVAHTIPTATAPLGLVAVGKTAWLTDGAVAKRLNPVFNRPDKRIPLGGAVPLGGRTTPIAADGGAILIATGTGVSRIGPGESRPSKPLETGDGPSGIVVKYQATWVSDGLDDAVVRIDHSGALKPIPVKGSPTGIAAGAGAVWVVTSDDTLLRMDPIGAQDTTIDVGRSPTGVAVGDGFVWVANGLDGTIWKIDPRRNEVVDRIKVGSSPQNIAYIGGKLWVPMQAGLSSALTTTPGGTARVNVQLADLSKIEGLDPALNASTYGSQIDYATCLKLLNYPDAQGPTGSQLVPEAATSFPKVSDGGKTYTFTIRRGFRFSPPSGEPVTAETFRYSIERSLELLNSKFAYVFEDIVGFPVEKGTHVRGVTARGDKLTIRLRARQPDFPARIDHFCAVPIGTPLEDFQTIPAAGPYYVASETPQRVVLRRNPNYAGDRPHRLDGIVFTFGISHAQTLADIDRGRADYALDGLSRAADQRLAVRFGPGSPAAQAGHERYFQAPQTILQYLVLNAHRPLFGSLRLRKAVNYAIDRATLARLGSPSTDPAVCGPQLPADHYLPPGLPGYRDAHIYPLDGPNLATARRLASGLGGKAVMFSCKADPCPQIAATVKANLKAIGIDVEIKEFPLPTMYDKETAPGARFDIGIGGWGVDYADPQDILNPLFEGKFIAFGLNTSRFNDPVWNRRLEAAAGRSGRLRYRTYGNLDIALARDAAPVAAWATRTRSEYFSARMGCQIEHPVNSGVDLAALCIRH